MTEEFIGSNVLIRSTKMRILVQLIRIMIHLELKKIIEQDWRMFLPGGIKFTRMKILVQKANGLMTMTRHQMLENEEG